MFTKKIGLALSGGGFRATVFHMGVLARLAEEGLLENVSALSTVSGGSLAAGLIFALNGLNWPTSAQYKSTVLAEARKRLTTVDLQSALIWRVINGFFTLRWVSVLNRAKDLSQLLTQRWGVTGQLNQLPASPQWFINATCYESGKDWRFEKSSAGDRRFGWTDQTDTIAVSDALAASAAFPGLVGALDFDLTRHGWEGHVTRMPGSWGPQLFSKDYPIVHLWDGGAYDNNGLEVFHDFDLPRWQRGVEFLIVSDAAGPDLPEAYQVGLKALFRIITGVMMEQIRSLRSRAVVALMRAPNTAAPGAYLRTGNTCKRVFDEAKISPPPNVDCLSDAEAAAAAGFQTEIRRLTTEEFERLFRHGFEVADCTLYAYHPNEFKYIGYGTTGWPSIVL